MADHLECPHCRSAIVCRLGKWDNDAALDAEFMREGFTHSCAACYDEHGNQAAAHFFVDDEGGVFKVPPRPEGGKGLCEFRWAAVIKPAPGVQPVHFAEDDGTIEDLEPGVVYCLPAGMKVQPVIDDFGPDDVEWGEDEDDDDFLPDADEIEDTFDEAFENARLKADGIPTERGYREKGEAQPSWAVIAAVWLFRAGAAAGAGTGIVWLAKQILKGAL